MTPLRNLARRFAQEPIMIGMLLLSSGGVWAFFEVADEVVEGESHAMDERIVLALRNPDDPSDPVGPRWFEELMRDFTALGGVGIVTLLGVAVTAFLLMLGQRRQAAWLAIALTGGIIFSLALKSFFDRPRPELVPHGSHVYTRSFPSGHSMMAATVYLTLGAVLAEMVRKRRLKAYLIAVAALVTIAVGVSRVYLGVHWPTDVLAGWALGAAWAMGCWIVARLLQLRPVDAPAN